MKKVLIMGMALLSISVFASDKGNGGNECSKEFSRYGRIIHDIISDDDYFKKKIDLKKFDEAINSAYVIVADGPLYDRNGGIVPAQNDGRGTITLSKKEWCESRGYVDPSIVLHEFLGISEPGIDFQYQISGILFSQTGLDYADFNNYYRSGSDFKIKKISFNSLLDSTVDSITIETRSIKEYFNYLYVAESERYGYRAQINCSTSGSRLEVFSLYAVSNKGKWHYENRFLQTYKFKNTAQCKRLLGQAKLIGDQGVEVELGLDSLNVLSF